jgi:uncharacterized protein YqfA (UPF0365 family)
MTELIGGGIGLLVLGAVVLAFILFLVPLNLWIAAWASGAYVGLPTLIAMRLRRVPPGTIVTARISAVKAGLDISLNDLEAHYLAGGNVVRVVNALISADKANIPLVFQRAAAIDLAGRDVLEAVKMSVIPKVIETPRIAAIAKNGIQLIAVSRVTVRTNIDRLVGGAGEETIIARVGEGMVSTIGSAESHKDVLENPDHISKHILAKGLDAGTAYEILSIDIADVDVGENIGAKLQIDQANADKQIAQAKAEERRAMAVALEQEMRARVVEAEAEVPRAMAEAFRAGNLGIMDYYKMKNVQADTEMRDSIATYRREEPTYRHDEPSYDEEPAYEEAPMFEEEPVFTLERESEWLESAEAESPPMWAEPAGPPPVVREPRRHQAPPAPIRPAIQAPAQSATRSGRRSHWLRHPGNARRGIVMMTVLGRCRGLD